MPHPSRRNAPSNGPEGHVSSKSGTPAGPDILELYRWAVQDPETHVAVLIQMYSRLRDGLHPTILREDFAGTAAESVAWVASDKTRTAIATDRDRATLEWAQRRAARLLQSDTDRVQFVEGDVLDIVPPHVPTADVICVLNFSILYFHCRSALHAYFQHTRRCLAPDGILVFNVFGGPGAMRDSLDQRPVRPAPRTPLEHAPPPFEYRWEQRDYNAVTGQLECHIHFVLDQAPTRTGTTKVDRAFSYNWRLWTLPELLELVQSAGFSDVQVWRHTYDESRGRDGVFLGPVTSITNEETWLAYIVALP